MIGKRKTRSEMGIAAVVFVFAFVWSAQAYGLTPIERLGKRLFFDTDLSSPRGQSCAACHGPKVGFTGPDSDINAKGAVYPGAVSRRFGNRKPPSSAYAGDSPVLHLDQSNVWTGGMFWDGRATGWILGDPLAEQAQGPFLNPLEQNNPKAKSVCIKVMISEYAKLFQQVWDWDRPDFVRDVPGTYERIARSIAAYERSDEVNPFDSKYDYYLRGQAQLTDQEQLGLALFEGKANCSACHISQAGPSGEPPVFTDFTYDNLGVPKNPLNPFYDMPRRWNPDGHAWVDYGLGGFLKSLAPKEPEAYEPELGKMKVPTLRNVDKRPCIGFVKAYAHNGYFKSLEEIVHFYNTRDVAGAGWPEPEVSTNVNKSELGNLGLTAEEEAAIVAFMKTLSDGYKPVDYLVDWARELGYCGAEVARYPGVTTSRATRSVSARPPQADGYLESL